MTWWQSAPVVDEGAGGSDWWKAVPLAAPEPVAAPDMARQPASTWWEAAPLAAEAGAIVPAQAPLRPAAPRQEAPLPTMPPKRRREPRNAFVEADLARRGAIEDAFTGTLGKPSPLSRGFGVGVREMAGMAHGAGETVLRLLDDAGAGKAAEAFAELSAAGMGHTDALPAGLDQKLFNETTAWLSQQRREWLEAAQAGAGAPPQGIDEWLAFNIGRTTPQIAAAVASGLVGGIPGLATYSWLFGTEEAKGALEAEGIGADATVTMGPFTLTGTQLAAATGIPIAAIEMIGGPERLIRQMLARSGTEAGKGMLRQVLSQALTTAGLEGAEEVAQGYVAAISAREASGKPFDNEFWQRTAREGLEQGAAVMPAAALFGGGMAMLQQSRPAPAAEPAPAAPQEPQAPARPQQGAGLPGHGGAPTATFQEPAAPGYGEVSGVPSGPSPISFDAKIGPPLARPAESPAMAPLGAAGEADGARTSRMRRVLPAENMAQGRDAASRVLSDRVSVPAAMVREDIGEISFDYGEPGNAANAFKGGWGLSHIEAKRGAEGDDGTRFVQERLPQVLAEGRLQRLYGPPDGRRADIAHQGAIVHLSLYRHGQRESWVITSYEEDGGSGGTQGVYDPTSPTQSGPTRTRSELGAEPTQDIRSPEAVRNVERAGLPAAGPGNRFLEVYSAERGGIAETPPVAAPIRREDIVRRLSEDLGTPIYEGRIKGKKTLGFFRSPVREVRIKKGATDLEVTAHEIAHLVDRADRAIRSALWWPARGANAAHREELRAVSYDQGKLPEGWAEFVRLWMTQPEEAQARAPHVFDWFEEYLNGSERFGPALRRAQEGMTAWFAQDAATRAKSKIGAVETVANEALNSLWNRFRTSVADDLEGIRIAEKTIEGNTSPLGAYEVARLTRGASAIIDGALRFGAPKVNPDGSHTFVGKGLIEILEPVSADLDNFLAYAVGRRAHVLNAQGRERLFTRQEIQGLLALRTPVYDRVLADYQAFNRTLLDFASHKGVVSPEARAKWDTEVYVPFFRVRSAAGSAKGEGGTPGDFGIKALTGGTGELRNILENMISNTSMLIQASLANEAISAVARVAEQEGGARFMARIPAEDKRVTILRSSLLEGGLEAFAGKLGWQAERDIKKGNEAPTDIADQARREFENFEEAWSELVNQLPPFLQVLQGNMKPGGPNVIVRLIGGKPIYYEVADPLLMRAFQALRRPTKPRIIRFLSAFRRLSQASITLSIDFLVRNVARDTLMGGIMSKHGFKPFVDSVRGLKSRIAQDANYREFIANGGGFASYLMDEEAFKADLHRFYTRKGINPRTVLDTPMKLLLGLERIADAFEMSTRLGEFKKARAKGAHPRHAAYEAREVSTDFAMRGDSTTLGFFFDTVPFLKAALNGLDRSYRGYAWDSNRGDIAQRTAWLALFSMGLYMLNRGRPEYEDLEDWDRDSYWHLWVGDEHYRYPKIWEVGAIATLSERSLQTGLDGPDAEIFEAMARVVLRMFNLETIPFPAALGPLAEQYANRISFIDRPIETDAMQRLEPWARAGTYTSRSLRALGEATRALPRDLQVSPARAEALLRGYLNTWAMYGLTLSDSLFFDDAPDLRTDQYPGIRSFYQQEPARHTRHVTQFYDLARELAEARATARDAARRWRPELAEELAKRREAQLARGMGKASKRMGDIRSAMAAVAEAPDLETTRKLAQSWGMRDRSGTLGALKRRLLDDMTRARNKLAKQAVREVQKALGIERAPEHGTVRAYPRAGGAVPFAGPAGGARPNEMALLLMGQR